MEKWKPEEDVSYESEIQSSNLVRKKSARQGPSPRKG